MFDRKKQIKWASLRVGIVITVTLLIIFLVIVFSGGIQDLFKERTYLQIYISDVKGLRKGAPVRIAGVDVGEVKEIKLHKLYGTIVTISIDKEVLNYLRSDAKATVQTIGLLGDKYIEIYTGESSLPFKPSTGLQGYPQTEVREIINIASSTMSKIESLISKLDDLVIKIDKAQGTIPKLLNDPSLYNNLNATVLELKSTIQDINSGSIGMLAKDKELYQKLSTTVNNLENTTNKIASSEGSLGKLINDPMLYDNLVRTTQKLEKLIEEIDKSEGTASLLLKDKKTADDIKESIKEIKELIQEIKKNPKKFFKFSVF